MAEAFVERRRWPRIAVSKQARLERTAEFDVRVLDISLGGVLIATPEAVAKQHQARISVRLGDVPIEADLEVRRVTRDRDGSDYKVAGRFVGLDEATREAMRRFLTAASREDER